MKFKFSLRRLFIVTTVIAVILAICDWLGIFEIPTEVLASLGVYCLIYGTWFGIFLAPRYLREWQEFGQKRKQLKLKRQTLEEQTQKAMRASALATHDLKASKPSDSDGPCSEGS